MAISDRPICISQRIRFDDLCLEKESNIQDTSAVLQHENRYQMVRTGDWLDFIDRNCLHSV